MAFFEQVKGKLTEIYRTMTTKDGNIGGKALLYVEDTHAPFDGKIDFQPNPPGKRSLYEIDQLSGGEKTVAALALVFALAEIKQPPFIMLDEVDAFLDKDNVGCVTTYLQHHLKSQCLIVSHKEDLVSKSESLVGASFIKKAVSSKAFSLDLRQYTE